MPRQSFVVDASLLHELGERLIGRPAIALGELVKNAFDADATSCRIDVGEDRIVLSDNGNGMSEDDFLAHWMRIGTTHKIDQRFSTRFERPLTGSKGIGRLSAQFLANELILDSTPVGHPTRGVHAHVDWRTAVSGKELSTVTVDWTTGSETQSYAGHSRFGTTIVLNGLKNEWDTSAIEELGNDVWMLRSPFKSSSKGANGDEFAVNIEAPAIAEARQAFDNTLNAVFSNWKARIRGTLLDGRAGGTALVTVDFREGYPEGSRKARRTQATIPLPTRDGNTTTLIDRVSFEILVFKTVGRQPGGVSVTDLRDYLGKFGNVSVYDAGFRLPYYGSKRDKVGEDWLSIAADQGRRLNQSDLLPDRLRTQNRYMQDLPAPGRIFGVVEIDTNHERRAATKARGTSKDSKVYLQIQPGRDRLHDNQAFYQLRDFVRSSLDFYANRFRLLSLEAAERSRGTEPPSKKLSRALAVLEESRTEIPAPVFRVVKRELADAVKAREAEDAAIDQRAALLAPLASAGMAALALNHEIARESRFLEDIGDQLRRLATKYSVGEFVEIAKEFTQAAGRLNSLRELFAPLLSTTDKAATARLRVRAVVDQVVGAMRMLMPAVSFERSGVPESLRFPIGSLAEWNALLQNVLSNAWNAMLDSSERTVAFHGGRDARGREWLRVSDTGQGLGVSLTDSVTLFEPFERRLAINPDNRSIALGGQGLGLAIVRMIARRRGAHVAFIEPHEGFATTFEISWRGAT